MQLRLGCSVPFYGMNKSLAECNSGGQFAELLKMNHKFSAVEDTNDFVQETGCMPPCDQFEYRV